MDENKTVPRSITETRITYARTYPAWLNVVAVVVLSAIPLSLLLAFFGQSAIGLPMLFFGFIGIWVFGAIAEDVGKTKVIVGK